MTCMYFILYSTYYVMYIQSTEAVFINIVHTVHRASAVLQTYIRTHMICNNVSMSYFVCLHTELCM
jgi:hypothetical protein